MKVLYPFSATKSFSFILVLLGDEKRKEKNVGTTYKCGATNFY